ncbi:MAG: MBL fold metallo-hydrolase [Clostridia bacterium]|nr:MBL fold metallo-hydrolase [Clostridia bacterium]
MKNKKKLIRVIATWLVTAVMVSVFVLDIAVVCINNKLAFETPIAQESFGDDNTADRIHFLNTANSDCILIESNGKFALIDSGEGNNNPRRKTAYKGYEEEVIAYLKKHCADTTGKVELEFILATHMHYDHSGNFLPIINDRDISIRRAFIKRYNANSTSDIDSEAWGNLDTYNKIIEALNQKQIPLIQDLSSEDFTFGDFTMRFFNTETPVELQTGENNNSVGVRVTKGSRSAFLAADFTNRDGFEMIYAEEIGDIDLLKIGHHGYFGSSSPDFLRTLKPEIAICTNYIGKIYPNVKWNLTMVARVPVFATAHRNGIIATFTEDEIILSENIM